MKEEVRVELKNGRYAILRGYIKNRDRSKYRQMIFAGKTIGRKDFQDTNGEISLSMDAIVGSADTLIEMLLLDYCGETKTPFESLMDSVHGDDYDQISEAVQEIFSGDTELPKE